MGKHVLFSTGWKVLEQISLILIKLDLPSITSFKIKIALQSGAIHDEILAL